MALTQHLENIMGHLGAALNQRAPSDDIIIMNHVQEAYNAARTALIVAKAMDGAISWCEQERGKIGAIDGYDYRSGEEYGLRRAELHLREAAEVRS